MKKLLFVICVFSLLAHMGSCSTVRVVASPHGDAPDLSECHQTTSWSYFWGLKFKEVDVQPDVLDPEYCICDEGRLSWVQTKTTLGGAMLSLITIGIVNSRQVRWACAPEQHVDDDMKN